MLAAGLVLAGIVALSIHVTMLSAGVPFPLARPPLWARWFNLSIGVGAALVLLKLAHPSIGDRSFLSRTLLLFVILATIRETFRAAAMQGVVTTGWAFAAIGLVEPLIRILILTLLSVIAVRWVRSAISLVIVALATGAACMGAQTLAGMATTGFIEHFAWLGRPDLYRFPYPLEVMVPAYLTFVEPVIGTLLMTMLVWDRLPQTTAVRLLVIALLAALLKGVVGATLLFGFFSGQSALAGMLSWSQFLFEFLALGLLVGLAWHAYGRRSASPPGTSGTDRG